MATLILFFIVLGVLIITHELGHFLAAKKAGIRVDEFGFGFPPRLWGFKKGETTYSLNLIPFGGFVRIYGETLDENEVKNEKDKGRSLVDKSRWVQAMVLAAGVFFNLVLAWLLISLNLSLGTPISLADVPESAKVEDVRLLVTNVLKDSPAEKAGLKAGDSLIKLEEGGQALPVAEPESVSNFVSARSDKPIKVTYERREGEKIETLETVVTPLKKEGAENALIGIGMDKVGIVSMQPLQAFWWGLKFTGYLTVATVKGFGALIQGLVTDGRSALSSVVGPVGLFNLVGDAGRMGLVYLINFVAVISINLAVINLLPFPALDGGRLLFLLIEGIRRKALSPMFANTMNLIGFALLMLLMIFVTFNDLARIF